MKDLKNIYKTLLTLILLTAMVLSCDAVGRRARPLAGDDKRTAGEARYDPLGFDGDHDVITRDVPEVVDTREADAVLPPPPREENLRNDRSYFAVQLFASKSNTEARDFVKSIESLFEEQIKIDYQAPYYRVCVGRSIGYEEAELLLKKVNSMGFPKAWLVKLNQ